MNRSLPGRETLELGLATQRLTRWRGKREGDREGTDGDATKLRSLQRKAGFPLSSGFLCHLLWALARPLILTSISHNK